MFFRVARTQTNLHFLQSKRQRIVHQFNPDYFVVWLSEEDQRAARIENIDFTPHEQVAPALLCAPSRLTISIESTAVNRYFVETELGLRHEPTGKGKIQLTVDQSELARISQSGIEYECIESDGSKPPDEQQQPLRTKAGNKFWNSFGYSTKSNN